ncbi:DUF507 domain-containing protein [Helicobacter cholecystus]|uniref:DUF507 domain-containing protein n=1 Tax=Helicobacter cholecystus TaxID=45498 RepID=A0A3D8IYI6_9HELI|nr:DUF507 family protein [Helicobacter cholecystus]RDU69621.1 DUF507 domain-containing protein [Helicobacter cholecystus]
MKLKLQHAPYVANKVALDLFNSPILEEKVSIERLQRKILDVMQTDIQRELMLDEKARILLEQNLDEIEFMRADERQLFWMIKKQIAEEEKFPLNWDDRYSELSFKILKALNAEKLIVYSLSDNVIKNLIFKAIDSYSKIYEDAESIVLEKLKNYKKKLIVGSDEYELVFNKLYEEELKKKGYL